VNIKVNIGNRIKELRKQKKLSQEKLAEYSELDRTYINSVENGRRNISIENIEKISRALGCTLQEFFSSEIFNNKKPNK